MRRGGRQEVTGLTVNDRPRSRARSSATLRAILHNAARHGLESQNRDGRPDFAAHLRGRVEYVCMVDPDHAPVLRRPLPGPERRLRLIGPSLNRRRLWPGMTDRTTDGARQPRAVRLAGTKSKHAPARDRRMTARCGNDTIVPGLT